MILKDKFQPTISTKVGIPVHPTQIKGAQTFLTTSSYKLDSIIIKAAWYKYGSSNGTFQVDIKAVDGNGKPTGSALATATKPISHFTDSVYRSVLRSDNIFKNYTLNFNTPTTLADSTTYAMEFSITGSTTSYLMLGYYYPSGYTTGKLWHSVPGSGTWSERVNFDIYFETYTKYEIQLNFETGSEDLRSLGGVFYGGQTFTPTSNFVAQSVGLKIKRAASDIGAVVVSLRAAAGGEPSGEDITIGVVYSSDISSAGADWVEFVLDIPYNLVSGTQYAIVIRTTTSTFPGLYLTRTTTAYADGTELYTTDSGANWTIVSAYDVWFRIRGTEVGAGTGGIAPISEVTTTKRRVAIGGSEFWHENAAGDMVVLSDSVGDIDTTKPLTAVEAYSKIFIANGSNLKIADFANVKITTANIGSHPPDFGTVLSGSTSGASMVVDYIDAIAGAINIYGRRVNAYPFQAETITGLDDDENNISFTGTAEVRGPHWYDWTVFGKSNTFGVMPSHASLVSLYNGRLVLAGSEDYPHEWWMSRVYNPFSFEYVAGDNLTAVTSGSTEAGQIGDVITALIPYADDFFVFGCVSSLYLLDGDPTYGGTIESLSDNEGVYGSRSWCKDHRSDLYFFSGDGLYRAEGGRTKPISLSKSRLPSWHKNWDLDPTYYRVVLTFDPIENGILLSNTSLTDGNNKNYWYDITIDGFYPESYPVSCGILSSHYYNPDNSTDRKLYLGCMDGYIRSFDIDQLDDEGTSSDSTINSWASLPIFSLNNDKDLRGKLQTVTFVIGRNAIITITFDASGDPVVDSDGEIIETETYAGDVDYEIYVGRDAETLLSYMKSRKNVFKSGTLSTTGRSYKVRPRARGYVAGIKLSNFNATETWTLNSIYGNIIPVEK